MMMKTLKWTLLVLAGCLSACTFPVRLPAQEPITPGALVGIEWMAVAIEGVVPLLDPKPRLQWRSVDRIAGTGGCNAFVGQAKVGDNSVRIGPLAAAGKACITAPTGQEDLFFKALEDARKARLQDGQLILLDEAGRVRARFAKTP